MYIYYSYLHRKNIQPLECLERLTSAKERLMVAQSKGKLQSSSATKIGESVLIQKSLTCFDFCSLTGQSTML